MESVLGWVLIIGWIVVFAGLGYWVAEKTDLKWLGWLVFLAGVVLFFVTAGVISKKNEIVYYVLIFGIPALPLVALIIFGLVKLIPIIIDGIDSIDTEIWWRKKQKKSRALYNSLEDAINRGDKQTVQNLIENRDNWPYIDTDALISILKIAVENHDKEMVSLIMEKSGVKCDCGDNEPLVTAVKNSDKEIVSLLIEKCENINSANAGKTLLDFATDDEVIAILRNHGAKTKTEIDEEERKAAEVKKVAEEAAKKEAAERARKANEELERTRKLAEQGDAEAQYTLGMHYKNSGNSISNLEEACEWLKKASIQGHEKAHYEFQDGLQRLMKIRDEYERKYEEEYEKIPESLRHLIK